MWAWVGVGGRMGLGLGMRRLAGCVWVGQAALHLHLCTSLCAHSRLHLLQQHPNTTVPSERLGPRAPPGPIPAPYRPHTAPLGLCPLSASPFPLHCTPYPTPTPPPYTHTHTLPWALSAACRAAVWPRRHAAAWLCPQRGLGAGGHFVRCRRAQRAARAARERVHQGHVVRVATPSVCVWGWVGVGALVWVGLLAAEAWGWAARSCNY